MGTQPGHKHSPYPCTAASTLGRNERGRRPEDCPAHLRHVLRSLRAVFLNYFDELSEKPVLVCDEEVEFIDGSGAFVGRGMDAYAPTVPC